MLAVQIFDQKKFKKKDQGFLGVINVRIGSVIDLDAGGDGTFLHFNVLGFVLTWLFRNAYARPQEVKRQLGRSRQTNLELVY